MNWHIVRRPAPTSSYPISAVPESLGSGYNALTKIIPQELDVGLDVLHGMYPYDHTIYLDYIESAEPLYSARYSWAMFTWIPWLLYRSRSKALLQAISRISFQDARRARE